MWTGTLLIFEDPKAIAVNRLAFSAPIFMPAIYALLLSSAPVLERSEGAHNASIGQQSVVSHIALLSSEEAKQITGGCCGLPVPVGELGPCNDGVPVDGSETCCDGDKAPTGCPTCGGGTRACEGSGLDT